MSDASNKRQATGSKSATRDGATEGERVVVELSEVIDAELIEIVKRRLKAGLLTEIHDMEAAKLKVKNKLVGLSLSGGGIRSASFSLGLIQSFYETGLLRQIDYVSSVSGGAYAAACLASEVLVPETSLDWEEVDPAEAKSRKHKSETNGKANGHAQELPIDPDMIVSEATPVLEEPKGSGGKPSKKKSSSNRNAKGEAAVAEQSKNGHHPGPSVISHFGLEENRYGKQPPRVEQLVNGGTYLRRTKTFLNRWFIGVVLIGIVTASGMIAAASMTAFLFRCMDGETMIRWSETLGFKGDIQRAFLPCALSFVMWMIAWAISYWRSGERATGELTKWLLLFTFTLFLMAIAALLGTGDIDMTYLRDISGMSNDNKQLNGMSGYLKLILPGILGFSLLPYFTPRELIRSGTRPKNALESWVFTIASRALLFGVPLMLFGWVAHENISHYNEKRNLKRYGVEIATVYDLTRADFLDWDNAWNRIELEANADLEARGAKAEGRDVKPISATLWQLANCDKPIPSLFGPPPQLPTTLETVLPSEADPEKDFSPLERWRKVWARKMVLEKKLGFFERWLQAFVYGITGETNDFITIIKLDAYGVELQEYICKQLTFSVIQDLELYNKLKYVPDPITLRSIQDEWAWYKTREALETQGNQIEQSLTAYFFHDSGDRNHDPLTLDHFQKWNYTRRELRTHIDQDPYYANEGNFTDYFRFWKTKSIALQKEEQVLKTHVLQGDGAVIRHKEQIDALNWKILTTVYPDLFGDKATIYSKIVQPHDQKARLSWFWWSLGVFLFAGAIVNMNSCSLHGFYKERLASMWIESCPGMGKAIPLVQLETTSKGAPYQLFGATVNAIKFGSATATAPDDIFLFSQGYCGSQRTGFIPTREFARGTYDLASAVSLSGAALSPAYFQNPLLWTLMLLTNLRLGQWLPNPAHNRSGRFRGVSETWGPVPIRLIMGMLNSAITRTNHEPGTTEPIAKPFYCYVTDGGYIENLGLEQLLLRRCKTVIVCDVSCDPESNCGALMDVIRRARTEQGIHIHRLQLPTEPPRPHPRDHVPISHEDLGLQDLSSLWPKEARLPGQPTNDPPFSKEHVILASIHYPPVENPKEGDAKPTVRKTKSASTNESAEEDRGLLIYIKPTLSGDEDADLIRFRAEHPEFPHDSTMDQFYTAAKFESYRQLGAHSGRQVFKRLSEYTDETLVEYLGEKAPVVVRDWAGLFYPSETSEDDTGKSLAAASFINPLPPVNERSPR